MTIPGETTIRADLLDEIGTRLPDPLARDIHERGSLVRTRNLDSDYQRAKTTQTRTLPGFYSLFQKIIIAAEEEDGKSYNLTFVEEFPPLEQEDIKMPCFTAALMGRSLWPTGGTQNPKPRYMETVNDPDQPGNKKEI